MGRFLWEEPLVVVPARLAGPLWQILNEALIGARRDGRRGLDDFEELGRDLMAASLLQGGGPSSSRSSDVGSAVDVRSSDVGTSLVTVHAAAALLGVSDRRVLQLIKGGQLTGRRSGAIWLVEMVSIDQRLGRSDASEAS